MRSQCISRPSSTCSLPTTGTLFSAWQATTQALQPMQAFRSTLMPQATRAAGRTQIDLRLRARPVQEARVGGELGKAAVADDLVHQRPLDVEHVVVIGAGDADVPAGPAQRRRRIEAAQRHHVDADAVAHRAGGAASAAHPGHGAVARLARHDHDRHPHAATGIRKLHFVALLQPGAPRRRRRQQQRVVPDDLADRAGQFLEPGIVGVAAVQQVGIGADQQVQRLRGRPAASQPGRPRPASRARAKTRCPAPRRPPAHPATRSHRAGRATPRAAGSCRRSGRRPRTSPPPRTRCGRRTAAAIAAVAA